MKFQDLFLFAVIFIGPLSIVSVAAQEQEGEIRIFVQIKGSDSKDGIQSDIMVKYKSDPEYKYIETKQNGYIKTDIKCKQAMILYADPVSSSYTNSQKESCALGEFRLNVEVLSYSSLLVKASNIKILKISARSADLGKLPESLEAALKVKDDAAVAQISTEIYARLKAKPKFVDPEPYRVLALDAGLRAVSDDPLITLVQTATGKFELPAQAVTQIKALQLIKGLKKTGALDWETLNALSGKSLGEIFYKTYKP